MPITTAAVGKGVACAIGGVAVGLSVVAAPFISPAFRKICLPYVPATDQQVENVLEALEDCNKGPLIDIGSGDGRILGYISLLDYVPTYNRPKLFLKLSHSFYVFATSAAGFPSTGIELNSILILYSKLKAITLSSQHHKPIFRRQDLFKHDFSVYDNIVVFGVDSLMPALEDKLNRELTRPTNLIACRFPFERFPLKQTIGSGVDSVWLYRTMGRKVGP